MVPCGTETYTMLTYVMTGWVVIITHHKYIYYKDVTASRSYPESCLWLCGLTPSFFNLNQEQEAASLRYSTAKSHSQFVCTPFGDKKERRWHSTSDQPASLKPLQHKVNVATKLTHIKNCVWKQPFLNGINILLGAGATGLPVVHLHVPTVSCCFTISPFFPSISLFLRPPSLHRSPWVSEHNRHRGLEDWGAAGVISARWQAHLATYFSFMCVHVLTGEKWLTAFLKSPLVQDEVLYVENLVLWVLKPSDLTVGAGFPLTELGFDGWHKLPGNVRGLQMQYQQTDPKRPGAVSHVWYLWPDICLIDHENTADSEWGRENRRLAVHLHCRRSIRTQQDNLSCCHNIMSITN